MSETAGDHARSTYSVIPPVFFTGERRVGKSTAAGILCGHFGIRKESITTPIYMIAREFFGMEGKNRALLQRIGDAFRDVERDWLVTRILRSAESNPGVVCDDVRTPREGEVLRAHGWIGIRIERPPEEQTAAILASGESVTGEEARHATETQVRMVPVDLVVPNDGTVEDLARRVVAAVQEVAARRDRGEGLEGLA